MTAVFMEDLACVLGLDVVIVISGNSWGLPQSFFLVVGFCFCMLGPIRNRQRGDCLVTGTGAHLL